jgi:hypothetical protein
MKFRGIARNYTELERIKWNCIVELELCTYLINFGRDHDSIRSSNEK